jgi:hypothetical protein
MAATNAATAAPPPAAPEVNATSSVTPDGTIHVTYVPRKSPARCSPKSKRTATRCRTRCRAG